MLAMGTLTKPNTIFNVFLNYFEKTVFNVFKNGAKNIVLIYFSTDFNGVLN